MPAQKNCLIKIFFSLLIASAIFLFSPKMVFAQVVINEFVPDASPEWVEFYNRGDSSVDLVDYYFDDDNTLIVDGQVQTGTSDPGSDPIKLSGVLQASTTCYLDLTTYLNNDGDTPSLFLSNGNLVDSYTYTTTQPDKSFSRIPDGGDWQTNQTPTKSSNKCADLAPTPTPTPTPAPTNTPTPEPTNTPTPTPKPTPTPTKKPTPTLKPSPTSTPAGEILGEEESSPGAFYPLEATPGAEEAQEATPSKRRILPLIFLGLGLTFLAGAAFWVWYTKLRWPKQESS